MVSVVVLTLNEADRIDSALRSASFASEVLVIDSGSTDGTVEKARASGARVEVWPWAGFVDPRNRALEVASQDHVFFLDADEVISPELARALQSPPDAGRVLRRNHFQDRELHGSFGPTRVVRLVRRGGGRWVGEGVHETLVTDAEPVDLPGQLDHWPWRSDEERQLKLKRYAMLFAQHSTRRARWWDAALRPPLHFVKSYLLMGGFRDGRLGLDLALDQARYVRAKWSGLAQRQR